MKAPMNAVVDEQAKQLKQFRQAINTNSLKFGGTL